MKFFLIFATIVLAANAELSKEFIDRFVAKVKKIGEECVAEVSASDVDIQSLLSHKIPESHEGKCLIFCFHKRYHIQAEDGSLDKAGAMNAIEPLKAEDMEIYDKVTQVFKKCEETPVESDPCDYSAKLAECAVKEGTALGLDGLLVEVDL